MEKIIKAAVDRGASDLHIKAGDVFRARIHGKLVPLTKQALTPEQTRTIALHLMPNEDDKARIDTLTANLTAQMAAADALIANLEQQVTYFNNLFASMNGTKTN